MKKLALHWQILIGMILGLLFGFIAVNAGWQDHVTDWVKPFGTIFINSLKLIAVPLIIASLIKGVSDLQDISKLSSMGGRTILLYLFTTVVAVSVGLLIVNVVGPGTSLTEETRTSLMKDFEGGANAKIEAAKSEQEKGPLQPLIDLVPGNIFAAASDNGNMLQVIFFVVFFGIGLILVPAEKAKPVKDFFDGLNEVILKLIDVIMLAAPFGVFALLASLVVDTPSWDIFAALLKYSACVFAGLAFMVFGFYPAMMRILTGRTYGSFLKGIRPGPNVGIFDELQRRDFTSHDGAS